MPLSKQKNAILPASSLKIYGRFSLNPENEVELISTACHFGFSFVGKQCQVYVHTSNPGEHNYIQYELDGIYQKKIRIDGDKNLPITISTTGEALHTVWVYKTTEAHTGPVIVEKISGKEIQTVLKQDAPLIEFIGNSITCGAASDPSETPCGSGDYHDQHNGYFAYGPRVARALQTDFIVSAVSGMGMYRNWNSDGPTMLQVYEKADFQEFSQVPWDFDKAKKPTIVSIALGTNDFSDGDGKRPRLPFDSAAFVANYVKFIQLVKTKYPVTRIALLSSPMMNGEKRIQLQNCLKAVKTNIDGKYFNDKPIALHLFEPMQARGCTGHPSVGDHALIADALIPFFKKLL